MQDALEGTPVHDFDVPPGIVVVPIEPDTGARARPGDPAMSVSTVMKARTLLGWAPEYTVEEMCATAWQFSKADADRECPV